MIKPGSFLIFKEKLTDIVSKISSELVGWISVVILHASTVPSLLGLMQGLTDNTLPVDLVLMVWAALTMLFLKAVVQKDTLNILTIGLGFVAQAVLLALIFFK